jgi:hypothetical protein
MEEFDTTGDGAHANWPDRFLAEIVDSLLMKPSNNGARVGSVMNYMLSARELLEFTLPLMKAVAADPLAADSVQGTLLGLNVHRRVESKYKITEYEKFHRTNGSHSLRRQY